MLHLFDLIQTWNALLFFTGPVTLKIEIAEDADINNKVIEVKAVDKDTASEIKYTITQGNVGDAFNITSSKLGGIIYVKNKLDYEQTQEYELNVQASDSIHETYTRVKIRVININDEPPKFEKMNTNMTIKEESIPTDCIFRLRAYDPDIGDRSVPQNISFFIHSGQENFKVDEREGCVRVTKKLDRDPPNGTPLRNIIVGAYDEWGLTTSKLAEYQVLTVNLEDINDNPPFYNGSNPVVWNENQPR